MLAIRPVCTDKHSIGKFIGDICALDDCFGGIRRSGKGSIDMDNPFFIEFAPFFPLFGCLFLTTGRQYKRQTENNLK